MLKDPEHYPNLHGSSFVIFFITLKELQFKNSVLVVCEILKLVDNLWTLDDKYSLLSR